MVEAGTADHNQQHQLANLRAMEDKAKEVWDKLTFCLVRCEGLAFYKIVNYVFCLLAGFQSSEKQNCNLKGLDNQKGSFYE